MTVEYVVLGGIVMVMGAIQTWLRHGPEGRKLQAEQEELRERRVQAAEKIRAEMEAEEVPADPTGHERAARAEQRRNFDTDLKAFRKSSRLWTGWTAILGGVGVALGLVLVILGILSY